MDIKCPTCREPWDAYHLRHDAIWETGLTENIKEELAEAGTPLNRYHARQFLEEDGWKFPQGSNSVLSFLRCPSCPPGASANEDRAAMREVAADLLGDDEDGLQSMLEDIDDFIE